MDECHIYTDGSYNEITQTVGYAAIIIYNEGEPGKEHVYCINGCEKEDKDIIKLRNYSGELLAAWNAIKNVMDMRKGIHNPDKVIIFHDYEGVGAWPTGKYKNPGNEFSAWYRNQMIAAGEMINIEYRWVKGHSGNYWNEKVDKLAKEACDLL